MRSENKLSRINEKSQRFTVGVSGSSVEISAEDVAYALSKCSRQESLIVRVKWILDDSAVTPLILELMKESQNRIGTGRWGRISQKQLQRLIELCLREAGVIKPVWRRHGKQWDSLDALRYSGDYIMDKSTDLAQGYIKSRIVAGRKAEKTRADMGEATRQEVELIIELIKKWVNSANTCTNKGQPDDVTVRYANMVIRDGERARRVPDTPVAYVAGKENCPNCKGAYERSGKACPVCGESRTRIRARPGYRNWSKRDRMRFLIIGRRNYDPWVDYMNELGRILLYSERDALLLVREHAKTDSEELWEIMLSSLSDSMSMIVT